MTVDNKNNDDECIRVLSFNINILPRGSSFVRRVGAEYKAQRVAAFLSQYVERYAIVALQEIFSTPHFPEVFCYQERLVAGAKEAGFAYCYRGQQPGIGELWRAKRWTDSGLLILSRYPIVRARSLTFQCSGDNADSRASKGVIAALIRLPDRSLLLLVNCHLQASHLVGSAQLAAAKSIRARQLRELEEFVAQQLQDIDGAYPTCCRHCLVTGDFNIDAIEHGRGPHPYGLLSSKQQRSDSDEYLQLVGVLERAAGHGSSVDDLLKTANDGCHVATRPPRQQFPESFTAILRDKYPQRLDYVFALRGRFVDAQLERFAPRGQPFCYLSDHFGIVTSLPKLSCSPPSSTLTCATGELDAEQVPWHVPPHRRALWPTVLGASLLLAVALVSRELTVLSLVALVVLTAAGVACSLCYRWYRTSQLLFGPQQQQQQQQQQGKIAPNAHMVHLLPSQADTLAALFAHSAARYASNRCLGSVADDQCQWLTYSEVQARVATIAAALRHDLRVRSGDSIGVWAPNCVEFVLVAQACYALGLVCVPLFQAGTSFVLFQIAHSRVRLAFVYDSRQVEYLLRRQAAVPELQHIVQIAADGELNADKFSYLLLQHKMKGRLQVLSFCLLEALGKHRQQHDSRQHSTEQVQPGTPCHVLYDFNAQGNIKAVQFTHANIVAHCTALLQCTNVAPSDRHYCSLPLSQITELSATTLCLIQGASVGFPSATALGDVLSDIRAIRPTLLLAPAAFYIHHYRQQRISTATWRPFKKLLYRLSYARKLRALLAGQRPSPLWDWLFFRRFAEKFAAPRLVLVLGDGCPLPQVFREFVQVCFCAQQLVELYVRAECGVVAATSPHCAGLRPLYPNVVQLSPDDADRRFAALLHDGDEYGILVGGAPPGPGAGTVVVHGPGVFDCYLNDDKLTADRKPTGAQSFRSNDVGQWLEDGSLTIFGNKRGLLQPYRGCTVFDRFLETLYGASSFVSQLFITCQRRRPLVAIIHPNEKYLIRWFAVHQRGQPVPSLEDLCASPVVRAAVLRDLRKIAVAARLSPVEAVHAIYLEPTPWTLENECLTPSLALRRHNLQQSYAHIVASLYDTDAADLRSPLRPDADADSDRAAADLQPPPTPHGLRSSSGLHTHSLSSLLSSSTDATDSELDDDTPLIAMEFDIQFANWKRAFFHRLSRHLAAQGVHVTVAALEKIDADELQQRDDEQRSQHDHDAISRSALIRHSDSTSEFDEDYPFV